MFSIKFLLFVVVASFYAVLASDDSFIQSEEELKCNNLRSRILEMKCNGSVDMKKLTELLDEYDKLNCRCYICINEKEKKYETCEEETCSIYENTVLMSTTVLT